MTETYYDVLDVSPDASQAEVRDAYRERVKETHPDVSDRPDAEERFKRVKRAEEVLGDPTERAAYDRLGHAAYVGDDRAPAEPDVGSVDDEVRAAAARAAAREHDAGGRSAGWRERERRARRRGRDYWADHFDGFADDAWDSTAPRGPGDADGPPGGDGRAGATVGPTAQTGGAGGTRTSAAVGARWGDGPATGSARGPRGPSGERAAADGWGGETTANHSYAVRDWGERESGFGLRRPDWTQDDVVLLVATMFLYPIMLFLTVLPHFPAVVNVAIGVLTLTLVGFLLPRPSFGIPVFGTWSLLVPALLLGFGVPLVSPVGLVMLSGVWLPLLYSVAVAVVLVR